MSDYAELIKELRYCKDDAYCSICSRYEQGRCFETLHNDAAAAIEALQAEVKRLQDKLCDWCAVCPKERRKPKDCELIGENPVMYGPSGGEDGGAGMSELKPCPFCGGEVYPVYWSRTEKYYMQHYKRNKRRCCIERFELNDEPTCLADVYEAWNRRAYEAD